MAPMRSAARKTRHTSGRARANDRVGQATGAAGGHLRPAPPTKQAMIFLLDSTTFSDLMRKEPRVEAQLAALDPTDKVVICTTVRGEILYGLERLPLGRRRDALAKQAAPLFATILCDAVPEAAGDAYAKIKPSITARSRA
jgi:predicted nucleic acid-binding protein